MIKAGTNQPVLTNYFYFQHDKVIQCRGEDNLKEHFRNQHLSIKDFIHLNNSSIL